MTKKNFLIACLIGSTLLAVYYIYNLINSDIKYTREGFLNLLPAVSMVLVSMGLYFNIYKSK